MTRLEYAPSCTSLANAHAFVGRLALVCNVSNMFSIFVPTSVVQQTSAINYKFESNRPLIAEEDGLGASVEITVPSCEKSINLGIL